MTSILDYLAKPEPEPRPRTAVVVTPATGTTPYAAKALENEVQRVMDAQEGTRNDTLNKAAFSLGQLVAGGEIPERTVVEALISAAGAIGLESDETFRTIKSGLTSGQDQPRNGSKTWTPSATSAGTSGTNTTPPGASPRSTPTNGSTTADAGSGGPSEPTDDEQQLPSTWARADLTAVLDGSYVAPTTSLMPRTDGICLLYPGLTHSIHGESESGKSWIAQAECARCIQEGLDVLYVDFESDAASVVERLVLLGCEKDQIAKHFDYRTPAVSPTALHERDAWVDMLTSTYAVAVIDGVTDALGIFGRSSIDNDDIAKWTREFPKQLASLTGAAVVMIDHVTKDKETRGRFAIGGQAKMASLTGAGYVVDVHEGLGKGLRGVLILRVAKDRPGAVRGQAGPMRKGDRTQEVARFVHDATGDELVVTLKPFEEPGAIGPSGERTTFRPTGFMEKASRFIEDHPGAAKSAVEEHIKGRRDTVRLAIDLLVKEGYVRREDRGNAVRHYLMKPFREVAQDWLEEGQ